MFTVPQKRDAGIPTTGVTNELADAIASLGQIVTGETRDDSRWPRQRVRVKASASGGGKYTGVFLNYPATTLSLSGNLADADAGTEGEACAIFNRVERNQSTHALMEAGNIVKDFDGELIGFLPDGTEVIEISGNAVKSC